MQITVRHATEADIPDLLRIKNYYIAKTTTTFETVERSVELEREWLMQHSTPRHRCLLAVREDNEKQPECLGFSASSPFRPKPAYGSTVEISIYCDISRRGIGVGRVLLTSLLRQIERDGHHRAVSVIALPNEPSLALHTRSGFRLVGTLTEAGRKFDAWHDVAILEHHLLSPRGSAVDLGRAC